MTDPEVASKRSRALDAVITAALCESEARGPDYFDLHDVRRHLQADATDRTLRRAVDDAVGLGWVEKSNRRGRYVPSDRAERWS